MARNTERRHHLLDAAVEVIAVEGGRGLTFGAVDRAAAVPPGTASNYFASRDQLLAELAEHVFVRLAPDPDEAAARMAVEPTRESERGLMMWLVERALADRAAHLALLRIATRGDQESARRAGRDPAVRRQSRDRDVGPRRSRTSRATGRPRSCFTSR